MVQFFVRAFAVLRWSFMVFLPLEKAENQYRAKFALVATVIRLVTNVMT